MKKLAVFDLDGTLHHTERALTPAVAMAVADVTGGEEPSYKLINSLYGEPLEMFCKVLTGSDDEDNCSRFRKRVQFHQARTLPVKGQLYPGVLQMLAELLELGFDLAILSNANRDYIVLVTEILGIREKFSSLTGRKSEASKTGRLTGMIKGYNFAVMVGDRYHDIRAGLENQIPVIACSYGYGSAEEYQGASTVERVEEIVPLIKNWLSDKSEN